MNAPTTHRDIIVNWQDRHASLFGNHAIKLRHRLVETGLFSREALARLIERCPEAELGLVSRTMVGRRQVTAAGRLDGASGSDAIAAIERGNMWMNIRRVMDWAPEYGALLDEVFAEFEQRMPGFKTFKRNLGVLISSPNAKVFYHSDIQGQSLWQISGEKRVFLYPVTEQFLKPEAIEKILLRESTEDVDYEPWFDEFAAVVDLHPGEMATWPLYAPHRVENGNMLNVSVTMEHWTRPIWNSYAVHYGNGVLRRMIGDRRFSTKDHGLHVYPKAGLALLWKKLGRQLQGDVDKTARFRIDRQSPDGTAITA